MFEQLSRCNYICEMDNLFISTDFCRVAKSEIPQKVMIYGGCWTHNCSLLQSVIQEELNTEKQTKYERERVKATVSNGNKKLTDLVTFYVYNTKPIHFLSTVAVSVK